MIDPKPPDVMVLGAEWPERALLRAQLIEEGYGVIAVDAWPIPRLCRRAGMKPRVMIIDLKGLPRPQDVIDEIRLVLRPERVVVIVALGTVAVEDIERHGYQVVSRPASIGDIVATITTLLRGTGSEDTGGHMRKQDRIARNQEQKRSEHQPEPKAQPQPEEPAQVKGSASSTQPPRPQRQPGRLPLPD